MLFAQGEKAEQGLQYKQVFAPQLAENRACCCSGVASLYKLLFYSHEAHWLSKIVERVIKFQNYMKPMSLGYVALEACQGAIDNGY